MQAPDISRRRFLEAATLATSVGVLSALPGCGCSTDALSAFVAPTTAPRTVYRLSVRGQRASNASKRNAAYKRFLTAADAELGRAHPGDCARVVPITVSDAQWQAWFGSGARAVDTRRA